MSQPKNFQNIFTYESMDTNDVDGAIVFYNVVLLRDVAPFLPLEALRKSSVYECVQLDVMKPVGFCKFTDDIGTVIIARESLLD